MGYGTTGNHAGKREGSRRFESHKSLPGPNVLVKHSQKWPLGKVLLRERANHGEIGYEKLGRAGLTSPTTISPVYIYPKADKEKQDNTKVIVLDFTLNNNV